MPYKNKEDRRNHLREYMREYSKRPYEIAKRKIRRLTQYYYGKVPKGYERHHLNYDSPHNFILIPIKEHRKLHKKWQNKQKNL